MNQVNIVIKSLFRDKSVDEMNDTLDTFWSDYTAFNNKKCPFDGDGLIWSSKYIHDGNSHI